MRTRPFSMIVLVVALAATSLTPASGAGEKGRRIRLAPPRGAHLLKVDTPSEHVPWRSRVPVRKLTGRSTRAQGTASAVTGTANLPVVLVEFTDNRAEKTLHTPAAYDAMLFQRNYAYGSGSLADYFYDQSGGLFQVDGQVSSSWLQMPLSYQTYTGGESGLHYDEPNVETLVRSAAAAADPEMNYCDFDFDGDNYVDTFFVVHAGPGAEEFPQGSEEGKNAIWSHKYEMPVPYTTADTCASGTKAKIAVYTIEPEETRWPEYGAPGAPDRMITIGVFAHEFGHALGLPDLYDIDYSSIGGVGSWDLMGAGAYGFTGEAPWEPVPVGAWTRVRLGWAVPQTFTGSLTAVPMATVDATHVGALSSIYKLVPSGDLTSKEYFLVEMRADAGDWSGGMPSGLLVWRVNENRLRDDNTDNSVDTNRLLNVLQADGLNELGAASGSNDGLGDSGDVFPGSTNRNYLDGTGNPNTKLQGGGQSGVALRNITVVGQSALVDLIQGVGDPIDPEPSGEVAPTAVEVYLGKSAPNAATMSEADGVFGSIASVKYKRKQRVDYDLVFVVDEAAPFTFRITPGRRIKGDMFVANFTLQQYESVGAVDLLPGNEYALNFADVSDYVGSDGTVRIGFYGQKKATKPFKHSIDKAVLTFD